MSSLIGQSLGRYHILEQLGEGGMAVVYKAFDTRLEANVAVKVIRIERLAPDIAELSLKRFKREAQALAHLTHPNLVKVMDFGEYEGKPYLVMPYLPGQTLKHRLKGQPIPYHEAARLLLSIARALEYAHQQGVIHRDVKPSNILITESGEPMLSDFGIAKILEEEATVDLTGSTISVGTPEYMAPEQATSKSIDQRADVYALGVVLYEMVTGRKPYVADTPLAVLIKHATEPLPRPRQFVTDLPDAVEQVILKALAKNPDNRYQNMGEFGVALERLQNLPSKESGIELLHSDSRNQKGFRSFFTLSPKVLWIIPLVIACSLVTIIGVGATIIITHNRSNSTGLSFQESPTPMWNPMITPTENVKAINSLPPSLMPSTSPTPTPFLSPTITPNKPMDPVSFVESYFEKINAKEYEQTWLLLTTRFQNTLNVSNKYQEYLRWWNTIDKVEILEIENRGPDDGHTLVYTLLRYSFKDGRVVDDYSLFHLLSDRAGGWLIDDESG